MNFPVSNSGRLYYWVGETAFGRDDLQFFQTVKPYATYGGTDELEQGERGFMVGVHEGQPPTEPIAPWYRQYPPASFDGVSYNNTDIGAYDYDHARKWSHTIVTAPDEPLAHYYSSALYDVDFRRHLDVSGLRVRFFKRVRRFDSSSNPEQVYVYGVTPVSTDSAGSHAQVRYKLENESFLQTLRTFNFGSNTSTSMQAMAVQQTQVAYLLETKTFQGANVVNITQRIATDWWQSQGWNPTGTPPSLVVSSTNYANGAPSDDTYSVVQPITSGRNLGVNAGNISAILFVKATFTRSTSQYIGWVRTEHAVYRARLSLNAGVDIVKMFDLPNPASEYFDDVYYFTAPMTMGAHAWYCYPRDCFYVNIEPPGIGDPEFEQYIGLWEYRFKGTGNWRTKSSFVPADFEGHRCTGWLTVVGVDPLGARGRAPRLEPGPGMI